MLNAPRERIWQSLNDPAFLKLCLPGCESMEAIGPDQYQATLTVGIAAVKGKYTGTVTLSEKEPPQRFTMRVEGKGPGGFMQGTGMLELAEDPARYESNVSGGCSGGRADCQRGATATRGCGENDGRPILHGRE